MPPQPRGVRNNNPGNIDYNPRNQWQGQLAPNDAIEKRFARFDSPENGIRALGKLLINYRGKDGEPGLGGPGIDTVREIVKRWAPGHENDTEAYIKQVARKLSVGSNESIDVRKSGVLLPLVIAIIEHENGGNPYAFAVVTEGVRRALA